jgi:hypothetical protein
MCRWRTVAIGVVLAVSSAAIGIAQSSGAKIEGRGDSISDAVSLQKGLLMVAAAHKGNRNFVLQLLLTDGGKTELLVNTIGDYQGVRLVPVEAGRYKFQVRADQAWVLLHEQPDPNKAGTPLPISHNLKGDAPLGPFSLKRGLLQATFTHDGTRNFVAMLYRSNGEGVGLLVNKIGAYRGSVAQAIGEPGLYWLEVRASGAWSVKLEMD